MYEHLKGLLASKSPTQAILDVGGIGFRLHVPVSTFEKLPVEGQEATLLVHLYVRDDAQRLYGFATEPERAMFEMLIGVSGIGPNLALTILSGIPAEELAKAISEQNENLLRSIKGIGRKTAQRVVLELKEKVVSESAVVRGPAGVAAMDAMAALETLNVSRGPAERAVIAALEALGPDASVEDLVRTALKLV